MQTGNKLPDSDVFYKVKRRHYFDLSVLDKWDLFIIRISPIVWVGLILWLLLK